ncbi:hypothetical protein [Oceanobacillus senegalensis]|uniref:hypothetical protein n=1 Tax=Oceanobacillus senegalensis TaxID=1936063 RepID=UPI001180F23A|nr:hypothetical protein [Oceanobacillus senegalensis]
MHDKNTAQRSAVFFWVGDAYGLLGGLIVYRLSTWFIGFPFHLSALPLFYRHSPLFIGFPFIYRHSSLFIGFPFHLSAPLPGLSAFLLVCRLSLSFIGTPTCLSAFPFIYRRSSWFISFPFD